MCGLNVQWVLIVIIPHFLTNEINKWCGKSGIIIIWDALFILRSGFMGNTIQIADVEPKYYSQTRKLHRLIISYSSIAYRKQNYVCNTDHHQKIDNVTRSSHMMMYKN